MRRFRSYRGYANLGPVRIPPAPPMLVLTDRGDGTLWSVRFSTDVATVDDFGHITIKDSTVECRRRACRTYAAGEEPFVGTNPLKRLYVRDGYLGMEIIDNPETFVTDMDNAPLSAVKGWDRNPRVIVDYTGVRTPRLAWQPWSEVDG
jgi:hypothetical protein